MTPAPTRLDNQRRVFRLIDEAIARLDLRLAGRQVLTEVASGAYVVTPLIAARAGATVTAVTADSEYGSAADVIAYGTEWASALGVADLVRFSVGPARAFAPAADIVTNLRFVRPIDAGFVAQLPPHAAIALMWEPWEVRPSDVDLDACAGAGIPVIGTRETDQRLRIFDYVGITAMKLLLDVGVELFRSRVIVIGSDPFGTYVADALRGLDADVQQVVRLTGDLDGTIGASVETADAVVLVEHRERRMLVGPGGISPGRFLTGGCRLVHIAGMVDDGALAAAGIKKQPARRVPAGHMAALTDSVGPRPVVDLHGAGLKVADVAVRTRLGGGSVEDALAAAEATGLGMRLAVSART